MTTLKMGRKPRTYLPMLNWSSLRNMAGALLPVPHQRSWTVGMPADLGMLGNGPDPNNPPQEPDGVGDCVPALCFHGIQVWSFNANPPIEYVNTAATLQLYERYGFVPSDPATDQGCNMQQVLGDWYTKGITMPDGSVDKLLMPPVEIDVRNLEDVREAIDQCGLVAVGFNVPAYIMDGRMTWAPDPSGDQTVVGGHGVVVPGFNKRHKFFQVDCWGSAGYKMKIAFWNERVDECYGLVHPKWISATGRTPLGLTLAQLEAIARAV